MHSSAFESKYRNTTSLPAISLFLNLFTIHIPILCYWVSYFGKFAEKFDLIELKFFKYV